MIIIWRNLGIVLGDKTKLQLVCSCGTKNMSLCSLGFSCKSVQTEVSWGWVSAVQSCQAVPASMEQGSLLCWREDKRTFFGDNDGWTQSNRNMWIGEDEMWKEPRWLRRYCLLISSRNKVSVQLQNKYKWITVQKTLWFSRVCMICFEGVMCALHKWAVRIFVS